MRGPHIVGSRVWVLRNSYLWRSSDGFAASEGFFGGDWIFFGGYKWWTIVATLSGPLPPEEAFALVGDRLDELLASYGATE